MNARLLGAAVCVASLIPSAPAAQTLNYRPVSAEYSPYLNRLVTISANPNTLHIYDPAAEREIAVGLAQPPLALSISPDGRYAAVGHDALISYVNLGTASVEKTFTVPTMVRALVLTSAFVYVTSSSYGGSGILELAGGKFASGGFGGTAGRVNTAVNAIYGTRDGTSPNDVLKYDLATGRGSDSIYHGDYPACGPVWFSPDGSRIYTGCGTIFGASTDPALDMHYVSSLAGVTLIKALSEAVGRIALIPSPSTYPTAQPDADTRVLIYDSQYLTPAADYGLRPFMAGGIAYKAHGRWLFFTADPNELWVVVQADPGSGLLNDFAVQRVRIDATGRPCGAMFDSAPAAVGPLGARGSVKIFAPVDCTYKAFSAFDWIRIVSGGTSAGSGTLAYEVLPNAGQYTRAGHILLGGWAYTITQEGTPATTPVKLLPFDIVDATYSKPLDRLIAISGRPLALHVYDPQTNSDSAVPLPLAPMSLSVRPDGQYAAVGHDGWVSYVNLSTLSVERTYSVNTDVKGIVLAPNGFMYLFPARDWSDVYSLEIATGKITATSAIYTGRVPRMDVTGKYLYVGGNWASKWDISQGVIRNISRFLGSFSSCGNLWLTEDGARVFAKCGKAYTVSPVPELDLQYNGTLSAASQVYWADEHAARRMTAVIPAGDSTARVSDDRQVQFYDDEFLRFRGAVPLPPFSTGSEAYPVRGRFVFWNRDASAVWAVVTLDAAAGSLTPFGIVRVSPDNAYEVAVNAVVNAASQAPGRIARGEIITLYGVNLGPETPAGAILDSASNKFKTEVAGTQLLVNGVFAPILYTSATQVNAVVPYEVWASEADVQVVYNGIRSPALKVAVAGASPAIYTMNSSGSGQAVAIDQNGIICDAAHPASRGSYVTLYFNGGGDLNPSAATGGITTPQLMRLRQVAAATVGNEPVEVTFAGAAPGFINSVGQLNIKLPDTTPTGDAVPIILTVGTSSSPATATIAVR